MQGDPKTRPLCIVIIFGSFLDIRKKCRAASSLDHLVHVVKHVTASAHISNGSQWSVVSGQWSAISDQWSVVRDIGLVGHKSQLLQ